MSSTEPLFPPSLISAEAKAAFPEGYTVRPLSRDDYAKGFLECLRVLSHVGDVTEEAFNERYDWISTRGKDIHYHVVVEHDGRIVGTGAMILERKFIHDLGLCGHVEEIAVAKDKQGQGLGLKLLNALTSLAKNVGCYKTTLGTSDENKAFYDKCGYEARPGSIMSQYFEDVREPYKRG